MLENGFYVPGTCGRKEFYQQHGCQKLADIMDLTHETCMLYLQRVTKDHAFRETLETKLLTTTTITNVFGHHDGHPLGQDFERQVGKDSTTKAKETWTWGVCGVGNFNAQSSSLFLTCNTGLSRFRLAPETSATRDWQAHLAPRLLCFVDLGKGPAGGNLPKRSLIPPWSNVYGWVLWHKIEAFLGIWNANL